MYTFICDYIQKTNKYSNDRKDRQKWQQCQPTNITDRNIKKLLLHPFNGLLYRTNWVRWYQKGKISQEIMGFWDGSGISWTICKQSAPCSRQITTPTPHHSSDKKLSYRRGTARPRTTCVYHLYTDDLLWRNFLSPQCRNCSRDPDHAHLGNTHSSQD